METPLGKGTVETPVTETPTPGSQASYDAESLQRASARARKVSLPIVAGVTRLADTSIVIAVAICVYFMYLLEFPLIEPENYIPPVLIAVLLQQNVFTLLGVYKPDGIVSGRKEFRKVIFGWAMAFAAMLALAFAMKASSDYSRVWAITWFGASVVLLVITRLVLRRYVNAWIQDGQLSCNVVVVGGAEEGQSAIQYLTSREGHFRVLGCFDDRTDRVPSEIGGIRLLGNVARLLDFARQNRVDVVLIALPWSAEERILQIVRQLRDLPIDIRLCPPASSKRLLQLGYTDVAGMPMLNLLDRPLTDWQMLAKTIEDRLFAAALLTMLAPLMLLIYAAVRLESPGPGLFRQKRFGFNNELIEVYKFRSMYSDMSDLKADRLTTRDDPRVTPLGKFLRKSSLDELPQIFNVLKGDMSFVGPRPHPIAAKAADRLYANVVEDYASRHRIKPGITGWAQVNGWRGNTDTEEKLRRRVDYDLYYIENWSLWFDLKIILLTISALVKNNENAY